MGMKRKLAIVCDTVKGHELMDRAKHPDVDVFCYRYHEPFVKVMERWFNFKGHFEGDVHERYGGVMVFDHGHAECIQFLSEVDGPERDWPNQPRMAGIPLHELPQNAQWLEFLTEVVKCVDHR